MRILVVDDDGDLLASLTDALRSIGAHVSACDTGTSAMSLLDRQPFDLVLTDLHMPHDVDGEVVGEHACRNRVRVVYMSGDAQRLAALTGAEVLHKPFSFTALECLVNRPK